MDRQKFNKIVLLCAVGVITAIFAAMIRGLLMAMVLAALFAALTHPLYRRLERAFKGRRTLASLVTILLFLIVVLTPLGTVLGLVSQQALRISGSAQLWVENLIREPSALDEALRRLPGYDTFSAHREAIVRKAGDLVGAASGHLFTWARSAALSTITFVFRVFVFLYTMFFFLKDGPAILEKILYYLPLAPGDERRLLDRFASVSRAVLKGTFLIGLIQGTLAGLAFRVAGIESALFWGTVMTMLAVIPGVGTAFVWVPTVLVLAATGHIGRAIGLLLFCALVVGSVDNILRPKLVGEDTRMPQLLIFLGTIGGLSLFGIAGFLIGPIIAALLVTVWSIYGETFKAYLVR